jgi:hypothetical protein
MIDTTTPTPGADGKAGPRARPAPTDEERLARIRELQARALTRPDPLAANLEVLEADLMLFAYRVSRSLEETLACPPDPAGPPPPFGRLAETYLKLLRQLDRLVAVSRAVERTAAPPPAPPPPAGG